jgi:methyl-accepting chemotaxis protein
MTMLKKIRGSFTAQLTLWVAGFVIAIFGVVMFLLARFSQQVVVDESIETTMQALENTSLRINNTLRQANITAFLEHHTFTADKALIKQLIADNNYFVTLNQSLPNAQLFVVDADSSEFSRYIVDPEGGYQRTVFDGADSFVFYESFYNQHFSLVVVCPAQDVYAPFKPVQVFVLAVGAFGLLLILLFCWRIITSHLLPVQQLADSVQQLANGHLDVRIPDTGMKNEIGQLQNSFATMQLSLASYMDEMQQKRVQLNQQNAELKSAYEQAQEYEKLKARFLGNMTDQMLNPINSVCEQANQIADRYQQLTQTEMRQSEKTVLAHTESVTKLLEQLLDVPTR